VISGVWPQLETQKVITVRFAPFESMRPVTGLLDLLRVQSVSDARQALSRVNTFVFNWVLADVDGNIGWQVSGRLPIRSQGDASMPYPVTDGTDNWIGWIPFDDLPHRYNPERGWVGTCNHKTTMSDYPYYYSSHASPSFRYRRLSQLLDSGKQTTVDDHWRFQRDTLNVMAANLVPVMAGVLQNYDDTRQLAKILSDWDFHDDPDQIAPTVFHAVYERMALLVFEDELGEALARTMLATWYFWQERLQEFVLSGASDWFDDVRTPEVRETLEDLLHRAALDAAAAFKTATDLELAQCPWGKVHQHAFVSPVRRQGFGAGLLGGGSHPAPGSGEVLCRGIYDFNEPYRVKTSAALRMVADLADSEKVLAVLPGGVSGRVFNPHTTDQIEAFMSGEKKYWWFSDQAIQAHTRATLQLVP
jgi:penicillin amidase